MSCLKLTPAQEEELFAKLRALSDHCGEALATLEDEMGAGSIDDDIHFRNMLRINRELWSIRWELRLGAGDERPFPLADPSEFRARREPHEVEQNDAEASETPEPRASEGK